MKPKHPQVASLPILNHPVVRWYLRLELPQPRRNDAGTGLTVDHTTVYRWVQAYAPELDKDAGFI